MKKYILITLFFGIINSGIASNDTLKVKSSIDKVTVFLKGGEIIRNAYVNLPKGTVRILFEGLSPHIDANSIQLKTNSDITILSVAHQYNFLQQINKSALVKQLEDKQSTLKDEIEFEQSMIKVYRQEEELILANKKLSSEELGVDIDELKQATEFYRTKLSEIKINQLKLSKKIQDLNSNLAKIQSQLNEINSVQARKTGEIIVTLSSKNPVNAKLVLSYFNSQCGWKPKYNLRAKNVDTPLELNYKAEVYQSTGCDWNKINLVLSTGEPLKSGTKPKLEKWVIHRGSNMSGKNNTSSKNFTNTSFTLKTKYSIPSNGKNYSADLIDYNIPANFKYSCVPKIEQAAFLMAQISDWEKYNLLSGEVNLFFEGTFVGKSLLDVTTPEDTLLFSLGRDKNVIIKREKLDEFNKKQFLGNKKVEMFAWEISVRNNKKQAIQLTIEDHLPISNNKEIDVKHLDYGGAQYDKKTGLLKWNLNLPPSKNKTISFKYEVKYPSYISMEL